MHLDFFMPTHSAASEPGDDPRIDPRIMWPLEYLRVNHGFSVVDTDATRLHGDILRVELERGELRVTVTWVPATEQLFLTQGEHLLGVHPNFAALTGALEHLEHSGGAVALAA